MKDFKAFIIRHTRPIITMFDRRLLFFYVYGQIFPFSQLVFSVKHRHFFSILITKNVSLAIVSVVVLTM